MARKTSKTENKPETVWGLVGRTFKIFFSNFKLFLPLFGLACFMFALLIGASKDTILIVTSLTVITLWLTSIFIVRRYLKGEKIKFRDAIYNAMTPLWSSLVVFIVLMVQCLPIFLLIIAYSSAVETNLFADAFAGSLFVLFAVAMIALTLYLLSGTLMAMVAVSAPGMYPLMALKLTREMMMGEKLRFVLRLIVMAIVISGVGFLVIGLTFLIELWLSDFVIVLFGIYFAGCFAVIFAAVYLYLYYRKVLMMEEK